ncbi:MAG: mexA [Gammaproteobacteria bacterium]|jgi:RND family efflux transporter MFP subunit|nr:mexA [Gammaproteobacteria bacterium]
MKKLWLLIIIIIVLAGAGGYYYYYQNQPQVTPVAPPVLVATTSVQMKNIPITAYAMGTLIAPQSTMLQAQQAGTVTGIYFHSGQQVKKGDLLITLNDAQQQAAYLKAQAALSQAQAQYHRYQILSKEPGAIIAQVDMDSVVSTYKQAQAALSQAQENLNETKITAPFDGKLGTTSLALGSLVQVGTNVVLLVNRQNLEIEYVLPETDFAYAQLGQAVQLKTDVYPDQTFNASVDYISPQIDSVNRTFTLRAHVINEDNKLSPGMLMSVVHVLKANHQILAIPAISLIPELSGYGVYIVKDNKVDEIYVKIGQQFNEWIEITSGLSQGQQVISQGQQKVKPGTVVKVAQS